MPRRKRPFRYVVTYGEIINCPSCDGGHGAYLAFYRTLKGMMRTVLNDSGLKEYGDIHDLETGENIGSVGYNYSRHGVKEILFDVQKPIKARYITADDGHGKTVWKLRD